MSFDAPRQSAETLIAAWAGMPIAYNNVKFDSTAQDEWCRITVIPGDSFEAAVGSGCIRSVGLITVQIFIKQWQGSAALNAWADQIAALFKGVVDNGVTYRAGYLTRVGHSEDFYQANLSVPFQYDVTT